MFNFFKRKSRAGAASALSPDPWELSEDEQLLDDIGVYTYDTLEAQRVDLDARQFIWKNGKALSIAQVAQRLHKARPHMPVEHIEDSVVSWLEEAYLPDDIEDGDMEEQAQMKIEAWLEAHEQSRRASEYG